MSYKSLLCVQVPLSIPVKKVGPLLSTKINDTVKTNPCALLD